MFKPNYKELLATSDLCSCMHKHPRWSTIKRQDEYNEMAKQAMNAIVAYLIASFAEEEGYKVSWENIPRASLYRAFQKVYAMSDTPEYIYESLMVDEQQLEEATLKEITKKADEAFAKELLHGWKSYEGQIYKAAMKIVTLLELLEYERECEPRIFAKKYQEVQDSMQKYMLIPGVAEIADEDGRIFEMLKKVSRLRSQIRWKEQAGRTTEFSVLEHLYDTALFAWLMALDKEPGDEATATKFFFMGIWHDVAETWTTDIPSPTKSKIKGLRAKSEDLELQYMEEHVYRALPNFLAKKVREVVFEDESNKEHKALMKGADYLSADRECYQMYLCGSLDRYFLGAIEGLSESVDAGKVILTPIGEKLHERFLKFARIRMQPFEELE